MHVYCSCIQQWLYVCVSSPCYDWPPVQQVPPWGCPGHICRPDAEDPSTGDWYNVTATQLPKGHHAGLSTGSKG